MINYLRKLLKKNENILNLNKKIEDICNLKTIKQKMEV